MENYNKTYFLPKSNQTWSLYNFSQNPIYLSIIIIIFGLATFFGSSTLFIIFIVLFILFRISFINWEEKKLEEEFGEEYLEYKRRVRRWL